MLYPVENKCRDKKCLSGLWEHKFDWKEEGRKKGWHKGFASDGIIPVPSSWNELWTETEKRNFLGTVWYEKKFVLPESWRDMHAVIRFGSANYRAEAWLNGKRLGSHEGGHLPFEFSLESGLFGEENILVVAVNGLLSPDTVPPGNTRNHKFTMGIVPQGLTPDVPFDFFPYSGLLRDVYVCAMHREHIQDLTVTTDIKGTDGIVKITVDVAGADGMQITCALGKILSSKKVKNGKAVLELMVPRARFWSNINPYLYTLETTLEKDGSIVDVYSLDIGIRTIEVRGDKLLLNGKPVFLRGFGRHEDFPVIGR